MDRDRQLAVLCGAIVASLAILNAVLAYLLNTGAMPVQGEPQPLLPEVLAPIALVVLLAAPAVKRAVYKRTEAEGFEAPGSRAAARFTATLVACALREAAGLLGFVLALLTGNPWWSWGFGAAAVLAILLDWPRRDELST